MYRWWLAWRGDTGDGGEGSPSQAFLLIYLITFKHNKGDFSTPRFALRRSVYTFFVSSFFSFFFYYLLYFPKSVSSALHPVSGAPPPGALFAVISPHVTGDDVQQDIIEKLGALIVFTGGFFLLVPRAHSYV